MSTNPRARFCPRFCREIWRPGVAQLRARRGPNRARGVSGKMEAGRLTSLDENLHVSCFDVCVARGGCGRMKPASSNFSAPRTYVFDLIGGTGAGTTDSIRDFLRGIFRRVAPKPKRPSRTPNRTQWRREDKIAIISGASAPSEKSHRAGFAVCCLVICDTRAAPWRAWAAARAAPRFTRTRRHGSCTR